MTTTTRNRIRALVLQYPGLHLREVARQLDISLALVQYHLPALVKAGQVELLDEAGTQRLFPARGRSAREAIAALRDKHRLHIVLTLLEEGTMRHAGLCQATGLGKSTLSFHLTRLVEAGIVQRNPDGYALSDPKRTTELLNKNRPTPDMVDRFANLWSDLYG